MRLNMGFKGKAVLLCTAALFVTGAAYAKGSLGQVRVLTDTQIEFSDAVEHDRLSVLEKLITSGIDPNQMVREGDPALVRAIRLGNTDLVEYLLKQPNLDLNMSSDYGETALMLAAFAGNEDLTKTLVEKGASINKTIGWSALHYAATNGHDAIVSYLLSKGADVNVRTDAGVTPLYMAARGRYRKTVMMLLRAGAYRDLCNVQGQSPADAARKAGDTELADYLAVDRCIEPPTSPFRKKIESTEKK